MRVPDGILKSVGFLVEVIRDSSGYDLDPFATGFFVSIPGVSGGRFGCFVTARHNLEEDDGTPTKRELAIIVNKVGGGVITLPQIDTNFWLHPTDRTADVAVLPINRDPNIDIAAIWFDDFIRRDELSTKHIGIGDEVYIPGLFTIAPGKQRNMPIVRYGNIAMVPDEPIQVGSGFADVYLVEARSIGGMSGSPVFVRETVGAKGRRGKPDGEPGEIHGLGKTYLLGLMHGHWEINESDLNKPRPRFDRLHGVNMGIAVVVPADKIIEIINRPELKSKRDEFEENMRKSRIPIPDRARKKPKEDSITQSDFEDALKKASRKIPAKK